MTTDTSCGASGSTSSDTGDKRRLTITDPDALWMLTWAASGMWQQAFFATEAEARAAMDRPYFKTPDWPRCPRIWRAVDDA